MADGATLRPGRDHAPTWGVAVGILSMMGLASPPELPRACRPRDFEARDQNGALVRLADFRGKANLVVLYFYPKDDTPGCTTEACSLRDGYAAIQATGAVILGVSADDLRKPQAFAEKFHLPFRIVADADHRIIDAYGVRMPVLGWAKRITFLVDRSGRHPQGVPERESRRTCPGGAGRPEDSFIPSPSQLPNLALSPGRSRAMTLPIPGTRSRMVFFNHATRQMTAKIVYYGPGLCGKTTNLNTIYGKTSQKARGEMVSLNTETDRTLFFDLLPMDVGMVGGFKTKLQLYTVPGQVFYNSTRKLVLKGVDGIVFVVDSQTAMLDACRESFQNLSENLKELGPPRRGHPHRLPVEQARPEERGAGGRAGDHLQCPRTAQFPVGGGRRIRRLRDPAWHHEAVPVPHQDPRAG